MCLGEGVDWISVKGFPAKALPWKMENRCQDVFLHFISVFGWIFVPKVSLGILAHRTSEDDGLGWSYITSEVRGPVVRGSMKPFEPLSGGASIPRALGKMLVHFHRGFFFDIPTFWPKKHIVHPGKLT